MAKTILILDEDGYSDKLTPLFQNKLGDPSIQTTYTGSVSEFKEMLSSNNWDFVLVNFHSPIFWDMKISEISRLILEVKKHGSEQFRFMTFAVVPEVVECLVKNGITEIGRKDYDFAHLRGSINQDEKSISCVTTLSMLEVVKIVCDYTGISEKKIFTITRKREVVAARNLAVFLIKRYLPIGFKKIGNFFSGKDHTTVLYSYKTVKDLMGIYPEVKDKVLFLQEKIEDAFSCAPLPEKKRGCYRKLVA